MFKSNYVVFVLHSYAFYPLQQFFHDLSTCLKVLLRVRNAYGGKKRVKMTLIIIVHFPACNISCRNLEMLYSEIRVNNTNKIGYTAK